MLSGLESRKTEMAAVLGEVKQQLEDIKKALLKLTKADLDQLRRMPDPPIPIRRTLEMVHLILNSPLNQGIRHGAYQYKLPVLSNLPLYTYRQLTAIYTILT